MATLQGSRTADAGDPQDRRRPFLEIQYHPGNIRRGVRYAFLSRRQVGWWITGGVLWAAFVLFGLAITPTVVKSRVEAQRYEDLKAERAREGQRLQEMLGQLTELEAQSAQALVEMSKIHLAYGLAEESQGQGGYPVSSVEPAVSGSSIFAADVERAQVSHAEIEGQIEALRVFLEEVRAFEAANEDQVRTTPSVSPLHSDTFVMTSPFGTRRSPFTKEIDFHAGIDLAAQPGTPIYAPADGTVTFASRFPLRQSVAWWRYGNLVAIRNGDRFMTLYGHCEEILVKVGQKVEQGQQIATVGDTGWSTNPHLHYEVRWSDEEGNWTPVDPRIYILDHHWRDEERMLIRARRAPNSQEFQPLPRVIGR